MIDKNPDYTVGHKKNSIATRCRICGGQLTHPDDIKSETHLKCVKKYKSRIR